MTASGKPAGQFETQHSPDEAKPTRPPSPNGPNGPASTGQVDDNQDDLGRDANDAGKPSTNRHPSDAKPSR